MIHKTSRRGNAVQQGWLLFFYSVPSKPVNLRMKVWRRLAKAGAAPLKGSVYILPYNEEHLEFCQWLVSEINSMNGEGAFVRTDRVETIDTEGIMDLFANLRGKDYKTIDRGLDEFERKLNSIKKGTGIQSIKKLPEQFNKLRRTFEEMRKIDFFTSKAGTALKRRLDALQSDMKGITKTDIRQAAAVVSRSIEDYQGKTWVTRERPFVDRMASAWLIKKFIDKKAAFRFIKEKDITAMDKNSIAFDIRGGMFTHAGDMCTFEALVKSFGFKDKTIKKIAAVVHELDIKDEKYKNLEARGIEDILAGIRKSSKNDAEMIERGINVFEMLYASKS
ncbi:MAG: chromate resistance protein [Nitrospirae bacterium]|nr:chromate resistance protein [Nitrospirota bacterium]